MFHCAASALPILPESPQEPRHARPCRILADLADLVPLFSAYLDFYEVPAPEEQVRAFLAERLRQGDSTLFLARDAEARALGFVQLYPLFASWRYDLRGCSAISTSARRRAARVSARP